MGWTTPASWNAGEKKTAAWLNQQIRDNLKALTEWQTWDPAWSAATKSPDLGNGTLEARYLQAGQLTAVVINLRLGSTSSAGSGAWSFTLPTTPLSARRLSLSGSAYDASADAIWQVIAARSVSGSTITVKCDGTTAGGPMRNLGGAAVPFTWTTSDELELSGIYPSAVS